MQVFLPYPDFRESVQCLDPTRLGNQIWRECKTLLNGGWPHHPVAKMWAPYKGALCNYMWAGITELMNRSHIDAIKACSLDRYVVSMYPHPEHNYWLNRQYEVPYFIGNEEFHLSHRLNLLWKGQQDVISGRSSTNWYTNYFSEPVPTSKPDYYWPTPEIDRSDVAS